jgi:hypothetical protein
MKIKKSNANCSPLPPINFPFDHFYDKSIYNIFLSYVHIVISTTSSSDHNLTIVHLVHIVNVTYYIHQNQQNNNNK